MLFATASLSVLRLTRAWAFAGLFLSGLALARGAELSREQIEVSVRADGSAQSVPVEIGLTAGPKGGQLLEISLKNSSNTDVALQEVKVRFPWIVPEAGELIAAGGTTMVMPTQIVDPAAPAPGRAGSGTYLMARQNGHYSLVAFLSWKTFWSKLAYDHGSVVMTADGESRRVRPGETVALEKIWLTEGDDWQGLLFGYADRIAAELNIKLKPQPAYVGWSTWDYFGRAWTARDVTDNLAAVRQLVPGANLLQIDGGWWPARGDYTLVRRNLQPDGMKRLAAEIRAQGLTAGIHFDGMRGDARSQVAREHPDYFLHTADGRFISEPLFNAGEQLESIYFDFSNPAAVDYMRQVARTLRHDWGYDYEKIDFLYFGLNYDIRARAMKKDPSGAIVVHDPGLTSVERLHRALAAWRDGMGKDAYFLACSAPFGIVFGYADGLRTGYDMASNVDQYRRCAEATAGMFFLQGRVTWNDADYEVLRSRRDEDSSLVKDPEKSGGDLLDNEARLWADYAGLFGGTKLSSDKLPILREARRAMFRASVELPACGRFVPVDFWRHGRTQADAFNVMLGQAKGDLFLAVFNWSDHEQSYVIQGLTVEQRAAFVPLEGAPSPDGPGGTWTIRLPARHSALWRAPLGGSFDAIRQNLTVL